MAALVEENPLVKNRMELLQSIRAIFKLPEMPLSKDQFELLTSDQYNDFSWDCIVYVIGHSDIRKRHLTPIPYEGLKVVSLFGTEMGTSCFTFTKPIQRLFQWLTPTLTPVDIALALNVTIRERDPNLATTLKDEDAVTFLNSSVKLSPSIDEYFDKEWEFFEEEDGICKDSGSIILYTKDGTVKSLLEHADGPCKETVLSKTTILKRVVAEGYRYPIFIDLGCNTFSGKKSQTMWEEIKASYPKGSIGGKRRRKTRCKKKSMKRPKVKKLIYFP
jgi:hypothetical protein